MLVLVVVGLVVILCYWFTTKNYGYWKKRAIPYEKPKPLVGNMGRMVLGKKSFGEIFTDLYHDYKGYPYVGVFNMRRPGILVRDLDIIRDVLVTNFNKFHDNAFELDEEADPVLAKNPFFLKGDRWKIVRGQLTPQLTNAKMKAMFPLVAKVCKNLIEYIKNQPNATGEAGLEAKDLSLKFTTDNVANCAFGLEGGSFTGADSEFRKMIDTFLQPSIWSNIMFSITLAFPELNKYISLSFTDRNTTVKFKKIVTEAVEYREKNKVVRNDFLDSICELKSKPLPFDYTSDYMVAHCMTFFLDGSETSATVLSYALFELSINPDVQTKLRQEIKETLTENNNELSFDAIQEMKYLDAVFNETLRKYPPLMAMNRECTSNYKFPPVDKDSKELVVEKGVSIFIPVYALQHDPQYYPEPDRFDPDRFTEHARVPLPKNCFFGFGDGPRICLGQRFASMQVKAAMASIVANFELRINNKTKLPLEINHQALLLAPIGGLWLNFHEIKSN